MHHATSAKTQADKYHLCFKFYEMLLEDEPRSDQPWTCWNDKILEVHQTIFKDHCCTTDEKSEITCLPQIFYHWMLIEEFQMKQICEKFIPCLLIED